MRGKKSSVILVCTSTIRQQLNDVIRKNFDEITASNVTTTERNELSDFPGNIQLVNDERRILRLLINTDGVSPKQSYRGDLWPVYLALGDLKSSSRGSIVNSIIYAIISGIGKPPDPVWKVALKPLKLELEELNLKPVEVNGVKFSFQIDHGIFDNDVSNPF
jgi:hypothetical protein